MHGKYYVDSQRIIFIRYEMPTVLRMRGFLACKLSFRLLCQNRCTVRREQMPHKACRGHWKFRYNYNFIWQPAQIHIHVQLCLTGTSLYQRCLLPLSGICTSTNRAVILTNIGKTVFITKRKPRILELWYFVAKENPLRINVILLWQLFSIPHSQLPGIFMEEIE